MISSSASAAPSRSPRAMRAGRSEARLMVVGIGREPRFLGVDSAAGAAATSSAERARAIAGCLALFGAATSSSARASSALPAAISARASPPIASGLSGRHFADLRKIFAARSASPSASTCSPIAISGSISASSSCASPLTGSCAEHLVERPLQLAFGAVIGQVGDRLALEQGIDGRDRLDPELGGDQLVLVDVDLDQLDALVGIIGGDLFEHRGELLARPAPFRPEIEDDEAVIDGSITSRSKRSTASRSASLMPSVATHILLCSIWPRIWAARRQARQVGQLRGCRAAGSAC